MNRLSEKRSCQGRAYVDLLCEYIGSFRQSMVVDIFPELEAVEYSGTFLYESCVRLVSLRCDAKIHVFTIVKYHDDQVLNVSTYRFLNLSHNDKSILIQNKLTFLSTSLGKFIRFGKC